MQSVEDAIENIQRTIIPLIETIEQKYAYYSIDEIKKKYEIPIILHKRIVFDLPDLIFSEVSLLKGKKLFVLLDELEYLDDYKARCIGELMKSSDETVVIFKVGSRYMRNTVPVGQSSEVLQESHDFNIIRITDALNQAHSGGKDNYSNLINRLTKQTLGKIKILQEKRSNQSRTTIPKFGN